MKRVFATVIFIVVVFLLITFVRSPAIREVSGSEVMANLTVDPLDCMVYRGSDATFYYFDRAKFKTKTRFKVKQNEVELPPNLRVGEVPFGMKLRHPAS